MKAKDLDSNPIGYKRKPDGGALLSFLQPHQVTMIDDALCSLGSFGEITLVVENGRLRYLLLQKSYDVMKLDSKSLLDLG
jgi:hypothetical protein